MAKINMYSNVGLLLILLSVLFLAIIEGKSISENLLGEGAAIVGGDIYQLAFVILTLIIFGITTLHPKRLLLAAYSSMTLGLVVVVAGLFNPGNASLVVRIIEIVLGVILVVGGLLVARSRLLGKEDKEMAQKAIEHYSK